MKQTVDVRDPRLEQDIKLTNDAILQKIALGGNADLSSRAAVKFHFELFHNQYQVQMDSCSSVLQMATNGYSANRSLEHNLKQQQTCREIRQLEKERLIDLGTFVSEVSGMGTAQKVMMNVLLFGLVCADSGINAGAIENIFGASFIVSAVSSVAMAGTFAYLAHNVIPEFWAKAKDTTARMRRYCIVTGAAAVLFGILGVARVNYGGVAADNAVIGSVGYAALSLFLFLAACGVGNSLYANRNRTIDTDTQKAVAEYNEVKQKIRDAESELERLEKEYQTIRAEASARYEYGCSLIQMIQNQAKTAYLKFLHKNYLNNPGINPDTFDTAYPFTFQTHVEPIQVKKETGSTGTSLLALAIIGSVLCACNDKPASAGHVAAIVLSDSTDKHLRYADTTTLVPFLEVDRDIWNGVFVSVEPINATDYSPAYQHELPEENRVLNNLQERQQQVAKFKVGLHQSLMNVIPCGETATGHSIVYRKIAKAAIRLREMDYEKKYVLVYSDLMEHEAVSFYDPKYMHLMRNDPDSLENIFLHQTPLPNLTGISIFFIYEPKSYEANATYVQVSAFFEKFFDQYGAATYTGATLPNQ